MGLPLSILLIDDDVDDRLLFEELLGEIDVYDFNLKTLSNHKDGLEYLKEHGADICFVDYLIGCETGTDFISQAKASGIETPMILITGVSDYFVDVTASEAGAVNFIDKASLNSVCLERAIRYSLATLQQRRLRRTHEKMLRSNLLRELKDAIALQQFEVYLQPEVDCETRLVKKAEALVRWNHPTKGIIGPEHFIDVAEQSGLIVGIGKRVIEQVCDYSNHIRALGSDLRIAFNVSIAQMERLEFAEQVGEIIAANHTDPASIEIEITESVAMREPDLVRSHLKALKALGIKFAVDDFGTGHSGMATLKDFPFDIIKIDRSFVQSAENDPRSRAMAKTIFYLADVMRLETVAEGIETESQFAFARNYGATYAQGYLFSKPLSFNDFLVFLHRHNWDSDEEEATVAGIRKVKFA